MAYGCGYEGGYGPDTCVSTDVFCGGGYAGGWYAAATYGGGVPCIASVDGSSVIKSNVADYCVLDYSCIPMDSN